LDLEKSDFIPRDKPWLVDMSVEVLDVPGGSVDCGGIRLGMM